MNRRALLASLLAALLAACGKKGSLESPSGEITNPGRIPPRNDPRVYPN